jgi:hypothetical protein
MSHMVTVRTAAQSDLLCGHAQSCHLQIISHKTMANQIEDQFRISLGSKM